MGELSHCKQCNCSVITITDSIIPSMQRLALVSQALLLTSITNGIPSLQPLFHRFHTLFHSTTSTTLSLHRCNRKPQTANRKHKLFYSINCCKHSFNTTTLPWQPLFHRYKPLFQSTTATTPSRQSGLFPSTTPSTLSPQPLQHSLFHHNHSTTATTLSPESCALSLIHLASIGGDFSQAELLASTTEPAMSRLCTLFFHLVVPNIITKNVAHTSLHRSHLFHAN